ncbi:GntR family transcriptional regulator [Agromyces mangrovi Wang et al. 2018]|uniref:GntR family transcriptional regulator n=1 Tax=Agromyces mangrovi TaxID=1858653 RepID=UPI002572D042|nr:GntR family transcriptional regulator [Agromyces mangrovi]BDZ64157.1 hypothetical protein GCM10025877_10950 [Agromyces mangrovi]
MLMEDESLIARSAYRRAVASRSGGAKQNQARRVYALLRTAIRTKLVRRGDPLVESDLGTQLNATRAAVRGALVQLAQDGLVTRSPRVGTTALELFEGVEIGTPQGSTLGFEVHVLFEGLVPGSPVVCQQLHLDPESPVRVAEYFLVQNGRPYCVETCYWAPDVEPRRPFVLEDGADLPSSFLAHFGRPLSRSTTAIEAIQGDEATTRMLDLPPGAALLLSEKQLIDDTGTPRELQYVYYAAARTYFRHDGLYRPIQRGDA